ncbi:MAG TPA: glycosyltransferase family 4 protein [Candidatus Hydrogenedentes bacterium]|nr:glycosyltransferase family 4 protein [Candidatus Hydrogenedentota bacterium]
MNILHLFSNCKWTGPAEPALNLCVALRAHGINADFACAPDAGQSINKVVETARDRGIEPILQFHLRKHRHPLRNLQDRWALSRFLSTHPYDLIHCHLDNDHAIAISAAQKHPIPIVRSSYEGNGFAMSARHASLLAQTAVVIEPSFLARNQDSKTFGLSPERFYVVPGAVDTHRFDPAREVPDGRSWMRIPRDAFVVGIVARMQTHRHYTDLFEAFQQLAQYVPDAYLIVVGRGSKQEQVGKQPVRERGLERRVLFPGFIEGENYVGMLKAFDVGVFLVPGSDGTCRAAREIMAMGKPMIVADRGMLREIVTHEQDGLVFDGSGEQLFLSIKRLCERKSERIRLGCMARSTAQTRFSLAVQAQQVAGIYSSILT